MKRLARLSMFESATWRLTAWYMLAVMVFSLFFSILLYGVATNEVYRVLSPSQPGETRLFVDDDGVITVREARMQASADRLLVTLVIFNGAVLVLGTALSYMLARRTLKPIEEAHEAQTRFASDAAHELRTPLAVMQTEIEVELRNTKPSIKEYKATLESNLEEVTRLRTLTDQLLQLATQQEILLGTTDCEMAVVDAVTNVVPLAQAKNISIDNTVTKCKAKTNHDGLVSVLTILLENAIKYSPGNSDIAVSNNTKGSFVELKVSDNGVGIAPEDQEKIFDRFYRSDDSRSKEHVEGYGLGLSLARRIIGEMEGSIRVSSKLGKGSTFTVQLPKEV